MRDREGLGDRAKQTDQFQPYHPIFDSSFKSILIIVKKTTEYKIWSEHIRMSLRVSPIGDASQDGVFMSKKD